MSRISIEQIRKEAEELGWVLISNTYKNLNTEIEFVCPEGHQVITTYAIWRAQHSCPICDNPKLDLSTKVMPKKNSIELTDDSGAEVIDGRGVEVTP